MGVKSPVDNQKQVADIIPESLLWLRKTKLSVNDDKYGTSQLVLRVEADLLSLGRWLSEKSKRSLHALADIERLHIRVESPEEIIVAGWLARSVQAWPVPIAVCFQLEVSESGELHLVATSSLHLGDAPSACDVPALYSAELLLSLVPEGILSRIAPDRWCIEAGLLFEELLETCGAPMSVFPRTVELVVEFERGRLYLEASGRGESKDITQGAPSKPPGILLSEGDRPLDEASDIVHAHAVLDQALLRGRLPTAVRLWDRIRRDHPGLVLGVHGAQLLRRWVWVSEGAGLLRHALHRLRIISNHPELRLETLATLGRHHRALGNGPQAAVYLRLAWQELSQYHPTSLLRWVFGWAYLEALVHLSSDRCPEVDVLVRQLDAFILSEEQKPVKVLKPQAQRSVELAVTSPKAERIQKASKKETLSLELAFSHEQSRVERLNHLWARIDRVLGGNFSEEEGPNSSVEQLEDKPIDPVDVVPLPLVVESEQGKEIGLLASNDGAQAESSDDEAQAGSGELVQPPVSEQLSLQTPDLEAPSQGLPVDGTQGVLPNFGERQRVLQPEESAAQQGTSVLEAEVNASQPEASVLEAENSPLQPEVSELQPEVSTSQPAVGVLEAENSPLQPKVSELQPEESTLQPAVGVLEPKNGSLQPEVSELQPGVSELQPEESALQPEDSDSEPEESALQPEEGGSGFEESATLGPARISGELAQVSILLVEKPSLGGRDVWRQRRDRAAETGTWKPLLDDIQQAIHLCNNEERLGLTKEMALIYLDMGVPSRAERHLRALLAEEPSDTESEHMLNQLYRRTGEFSKAIELKAFLAEHRLSPQEAGGELLKLAEQCQRLGLDSMEKSCLLRCCSLNPGDENPFLQLEALFQAGAEHSAISELWKLREALPGSSGYEAQWRVALAQLEGGDRVSARARLGRLASVPAFEVQALALLGEMGFGTASDDVLLRDDVEIGGVSTALARGEALLHNKRLPNWERAEGFFRQALENQPQEPRAVRGLVQVLSKQGQFDEAIGLLSTTLEKTQAPQDRSRWLQELGDVYLVHLGDSETARRYYSEAELLMNSPVLH